MSYRTSRQDRAAQTNLEGGRRRKPRYSYVLTDDQRAVLAEQERDAREGINEADLAEGVMEYEEDGDLCQEEDDYALRREQLRAYEAQHGRNDDDEMPF